MSFLFFLNGKMFETPFSKFYTSILSIDLQQEEMICQENNILLFFCENPRTNISLLISRIEFFFSYQANNNVIGQLSSKILVNYNVDKNPKNHVYENCIIFTKGYKITEIIIYLPEHNFPFLRQLVYHFYEKKREHCEICYETKDNVVHVDDYHCFCVDCILQTNRKCPICRKDIQ